MGLRNTSREDIYHWRTLHIVNVVTHPLPVKIFVFSECDVMSLYGEHILMFQLSAIVLSVQLHPRLILMSPCWVKSAGRQMLWAKNKVASL